MVTFLFLPLTLLVDSGAVGTDTLRTFALGEVTVLERGKKNAGTQLDRTELQAWGRDRITEALDLLPGITVTESGDRNEGFIFLRGFDQRQIPVFMDGIPVSVPYDGFIDLNRLQTAPVARIQLSKGLSSLSLGGNTMGGAINIVSARPVHSLEVDASLNTRWNASLRVGTRRRRSYFQAGGSLLLRRDFRLPSSFRPVEGLEEGRRRAHSATHDYQAFVKAGFTPTDRQEYAVGYSLIRADKDIPVYLGGNGRRKYWKYRHWDKDQVFFHSRAGLAENYVLETRAFYDRYSNELAAYDDATYSTQQDKSSFTSFYDDDAAGGNATFSWLSLPLHALKAGMNVKYDVHRSHNAGEPVAKQSEFTFSFSVEDTWTLGENLSFLAGIGYFRHKGLKAENYEKLPAAAKEETGKALPEPEGFRLAVPGETSSGKILPEKKVSGNLSSEKTEAGKASSNGEYGLVDYPLSSDDDLNYQAAVDYRPARGQSFRFSFARRSRFASLKERYSYKMGKAWPNPDLKTEHACNLDLDYEGEWNGLRWMIDGYYVFITDIIQEITGVDAEDPLIWQLQNRGKAHFRGVESEISYTFRQRFHVGTNYTFTDPVNREDRALKFVDIPKHKVNVFLRIDPLRQLQVYADMNYSGKRWSSSDGSASVPGFALFNINLTCPFWTAWIVKVGVRNLFDQLYYLKEGYPQPGRTFYASLRYTFVRGR